MKSLILYAGLALALSLTVYSTQHTESNAATMTAIDSIDALDSSLETPERPAVPVPPATSAISANSIDATDIERQAPLTAALLDGKLDRLDDFELDNAKYQPLSFESTHASPGYLRTKHERRPGKHVDPRYTAQRIAASLHANSGEHRIDRMLC